MSTRKRLIDSACLTDSVTLSLDDLEEAVYDKAIEDYNLSELFHVTTGAKRLFADRRALNAIIDSYVHKNHMADNEHRIVAHLV